MANVTYLLGAGASYNALPVIDELTDAIKVTRAILTKIKGRQNTKYHYSSIINEAEYYGALTLAIENLEQLIHGCEDHISIDTYLKMLFLTENKDYEKMKSTMVLFFQLYDCLHEDILTYNNEIKQTEKLDKRYDAFFASILDGSYKNLPKNIKIISWNYDNQIEKAYQKYLDHSYETEIAGRVLNICSKSHKVTNIDISNFSVTKINGTSSYFDKEGKLRIVHSGGTKLERVNQFKTALGSYLETLTVDKGLTPAISFAWDNLEETHTMLEAAKAATKETDSLVIIGYSFPFFNRRIDYEIIRNMTNLKRIYIQDPNPEEIKDRVLAIKPEFTREGNHLSITLIKNTKQFHLPDELT